MAEFWSVKELNLFYLRIGLPPGYEIHEDYASYSHEYRYCITQYDKVIAGPKMIAGPFDSLDSLKAACKLLASAHGY